LLAICHRRWSGERLVTWYDAAPRRRAVLLLLALMMRNV